MSAISALAVVGHPDRAACPTCRQPGTEYVERESLMPVAHRDECPALSAERALWRDDLVQSVAEATGWISMAFHRPVDGVEVDLGAALGLNVDDTALARVEVHADGRRVRTLPLLDTDVVVTL